MNLQELFAPTWRERARADDPLFAATMLCAAEGVLVWPDAV